MNPRNWNSATGRNPCAARPTDMPANTVSASGVSSTRSSPKRSSKPSVARNTPPFTPTSSPITTTLGSSSMARAIAMVTAPSIETSAISASRKMLALPFQRGRQGFKQVVEHLYGRWRWQLQIFGNGGLDLLTAGGDELFFIGFGPPLTVDEVSPQPRQRIELPCGAHQ